MKAIYPGSFDPITLGHKVIIDKAIKMFNNVVVAIGVNDKKEYFLSLEKRVELIKKIYGDNPSVEVIAYRGLTTDFCRDNNVDVIVRGVRNFLDYEYERSIANINYSLLPEVETILIMTPPEVSDISSSTVRELIYHGSNPQQFLPKDITISDILE